MRGPVQSRDRSGWVVAGVAVALLSIAGAFRAVASVLVIPLEQEFGWSIGVLGLVYGVHLLMLGLTGPLASALILRRSIRAVSVGGLLAVAVGALLTTRITTPWQLVLTWGILVGLAAGALMAGYASSVANQWFVRGQTIVLGTLTAAATAGPLITLPAFALVEDAKGWRTVIVLLAVAALALVPVAALLLRDSERSVLAAEEAEGWRLARSEAPGRLALDVLRTGLRHRPYRLLALTFLASGVSTTGLVGTHLVAAAYDLGIPSTVASGLVALIGVCSVLGSLLGGWLAGRCDLSRLLCGWYLLRGALVLAMPVALTKGPVASVVVCGLLGMTWVATVPPTSACCHRWFGWELAAVASSWAFVAHQIGAAVGALGAGLIRQAFGSYGPAFAATAAACLLAAVASLRIDDAPSTASWLPSEEASAAIPA